MRVSTPSSPSVEQREEVALRTGDALGPLDVEHPHALPTDRDGSRRRQLCISAPVMLTSNTYTHQLGHANPPDTDDVVLAGS